MQMRWIVCGLIAVSTELAAQPAKPPVPAPVCIDSDANPILLAIDGGKLRICTWDGLKLRCFATDLGTGKLASAAVPANDNDRPRIVPAATAPKIKIAANNVDVCHSDGTACKTLKPKGQVDPGLGLSAAANDAGTLAALSYLADKSWVETFDVGTAKRIGRFKAGSRKAGCVGVDVLGDSVYVEESECGGSESTAWLATKAGKKIAAVGGAKPINPGPSVHIADAVWAFTTGKGDEVVFQDVKSGKVTKRIAIGPVGESAAMVGDAKRLVIVFGGKRAGDVAVVDVTTDKVTSFPGTRCP